MNKLDQYLTDSLPFMGWLNMYLGAREITTVFDVGACEAEDSIKMARLFPNATIHAFEPLPDNIKLCEDHIKKYAAKNIVLNHVALSDKKGSATFFVSSGRPDITNADPDWDYGNKSSSLLPPEKTKELHEWLKFNDEIAVITERLENYCKEHSIKEIDLIYMDVQGAELMVLKGAGDMLAAVKTVWLEVESVELYEKQPLRKDVELFMKKAGFMEVMSTVDDVSGDQFYIRKDLVNNISAEKKENPKKYMRRINDALHELGITLKSPHQPPLLKQAIEDYIFELHSQLNDIKLSLGERPQISVVMSMYNAEKYLRPAIESILNQTYRDFEFIIVDDGSSDGSSEIVMSYNDPRIRLVQQVNHKLVYSLNKAVHLARGEYIARMDADDISMPTRLEDELALFELKPRLGLVGSFFAYIEESTGKPTSDVIAYPTKHTDVRRALYINNPFAHGSVMYRKQAFLDAGDYTSAYGPTEDYELWRRIAEKDWELELIPKVLYLYRLNSSGISSLNSTVQNENAEKIRHELWHAPYVSKSIGDTLKDAKYYRGIDPAFSDQVYAQYTDLQMKITQNLLLRNWLKRGLLSSYATWRLDKSKSKILAHLIVGAILRRLHLKSSIEGL